MPGRANLMTSSQMAEMAPSRFGVPLKVLTNKKALDVAIMKHQWEMQKQAQELAGGEKRQHISGQYGLKQQELQNENSNNGALEERVLNQARQFAQGQFLDLDNPEDQRKFNNIYDTFLKRAKGGQQNNTENHTEPVLTTGVSAGQTGYIGNTKNAQSDPLIPVISPDGRIGKIPRSQLAGALKAGYKRR